MVEAGLLQHLLEVVIDLSRGLTPLAVDGRHQGAITPLPVPPFLARVAGWAFFSIVTLLGLAGGALEDSLDSLLPESVVGGDVE